MARLRLMFYILTPDRILVWRGCELIFSCSYPVSELAQGGRGAQMRGNNPKKKEGSSRAHIPPFPFRFFPRAPISSFPFPLRAEVTRLACVVRLVCAVLMSSGFLGE